MLKTSRAAAIAIPLSCIPTASQADGFLTKVLGIASEAAETGKISKISAASLLIDGKKVVDGTSELQTYSDIKRSRTPTHQEIDKAASASDMLGAFGGAEWIEPVKEVGSGVAYRTSDSDAFIKGFLANDAQAMAAAGDRIDNTTLSLSTRRTASYSSAEMIKQQIPGKAGELVNVGDFILESVNTAYDYFAGDKPKADNTKQKVTAQSTKSDGKQVQAVANNPAEKQLPKCGSLEYYETIGGTCQSEEHGAADKSDEMALSWKEVGVYMRQPDGQVDTDPEIFDPEMSQCKPNGTSNASEYIAKIQNDSAWDDNRGCHSKEIFGASADTVAITQVCADPTMGPYREITDYRRVSDNKVDITTTQNFNNGLKLEVKIQAQYCGR